MLRLRWSFERKDSARVRPRAREIGSTCCGDRNAFVPVSYLLLCSFLYTSKYCKSTQNVPTTDFSRLWDEGVAPERVAKEPSVQLHCAEKRLPITSDECQQADRRLSLRRGHPPEGDFSAPVELKFLAPDYFILLARLSSGS